VERIFSATNFIRRLVCCSEQLIGFQELQELRTGEVGFCYHAGVHVTYDSRRLTVGVPELRLNSGHQLPTELHAVLPRKITISSVTSIISTKGVTGLLNPAGHSINAGGASSKNYTSVSNTWYAALRQAGGRQNMGFTRTVLIPHRLVRCSHCAGTLQLPPR
jgi:hypothetical protein